MRQTRIRHESQEAKILHLLELRGAIWTPAPELAAISLQYCRAIRGLRKLGYKIENRVERHGRVRYGFYRLALPKPLPRRPEPPSAVVGIFPEFQEAHVDDN